MSAKIFPLATNDRGSATLEFAIALPTLIVLIWGMFQVGLVFLANAGTQNALGDGARYATLYPTPTDSAIQSRITANKVGVGNGTWASPSIVTDSAAKTKTITVTYSQPMNFLLFHGADVSITKSKVVHLST